MLVRRIIPAEDIVVDIGNAEADAACEELLDFCQNDPGVAGVCFDYELGREDLRKLYWMLRSNGAGHWVRGHYVALSTLAYAESLSVCADLHRRGAEHVNTNGTPCS